MSEGVRMEIPENEAPVDGEVRRNQNDVMPAEKLVN